MTLTEKALYRGMDILMLGLATRPSPRPVLVPVRLSGDRACPPRGLGMRH